MTNFNQTTLQDLVSAGVITQVQVDSFEKKSSRLAKKAAKAARQVIVDSAVTGVLAALQPGALFKHRAVWNGAGRTEFTRDEILQSLRNSLESGALEKVKLSDNNFQIFWRIPGEAAPVAEAAAEIEVEAEVETEEAPEAS